MVAYGLAVSGTWAQDYRERVDEGLMQSTLSASTDADRNALQLLKNESDNLAGWASEVMAARQALNGAKTVTQTPCKTIRCWQKSRVAAAFWNAMLVSGAFSDDGNCHRIAACSYSWPHIDTSIRHAALVERYVPQPSICASKSHISRIANAEPTDWLRPTPRKSLNFRGFPIVGDCQ